MIIVLAIVALLVAINSFYVASEFAVVGSRRSRVAHMAEGGDRMAARLSPVLEDPEQLDDMVAASQLGITASSLILGFYGQRALAARFVAPWLSKNEIVDELAAFSVAVTLTLLVLTTLQVVFGEIVPKAIALRYPERLALLVTLPMLLSMRLFRPLIALFNGSANLLLRPFGDRISGSHRHFHSAQEIEYLVAESTQAGEIDPVEKQLLQNAVDLGELVARQVMVPRNRLQMADVAAPTDELLRRLAESPYDRILVFEGSPDAVVGVAHMKDLLRIHLRPGGEVRNVVREVPFLPENVAIVQLWQQLIVHGHPAVVILDEYGGTAGLVTQEDIIEEVIGEVLDEFDLKPDAIVRRPGAAPLVRGDLLVEDVNEVLGTELPLDRADTIGGLTVDLLGRMPAPGDEVEIDGVTLRVQTVRGHSVFRVAVSAPEST